MAYDSDIQNWARQLGQIPTPEMAIALGIPSNTLGRLAADAAVNQTTEKMGIGVSESRLSMLLREDPAFAGTLGEFDREAFTAVLQRSGMTENEYFDLRGKFARRQQLEAGLFADSATSSAAQELVSGFSGDRRTIDYFVLNEQSVPPVADATDAELAAYLTEHQAEFRTQESRSVDLLVLSLDTLASTIEITDEQVAAEYERTKEQRVRIERRTIRQVPLATPEHQQLFNDGKAAGKTFDQLVAEAGLNITELGNLARAEITDAALAEAAFGLAANDFVVIPGVGGQRAVTVTAIEAGGQITLDEAREDIRKQLALSEARTTYTDILDQIEELRAAFQPLPQIAERFGLPVQQVEMTAAGAELSTVPSVSEELRQRVATAVFAASDDRLPPTIAISANNNIWFDLKGIEPARDQTLDEVRDAVVAAVAAERTEQAITAEVETVITRLKGGEDFATVATSINQFPQLSQPLSRAGENGNPTLDQTVGAAVFGGGEGHFGSAINAAGEHVVFRVVEITPPAQAEPQVLQYLEQTMRQSLYSDFITGLRDEAGVRVNQKVLDQLLAVSQ
jgi:peptidyl-prolyl cis-trans isomerase D